MDKINKSRYTSEQGSERETMLHTQAAQSVENLIQNGYISATYKKK
jgi:hypothetical protein